LDKLNGFIEQGHVILFETNYLLQFAETVINQLKDFSLANENGEFSAHEIDFKKLNLDELKAKAVLHLYFDKSSEPLEPGSPVS
jgi:hypothetical protein